MDTARTLVSSRRACLPLKGDQCESEAVSHLLSIVLHAHFPWPPSDRGNFSKSAALQVLVDGESQAVATNPLQILCLSAAWDLEPCMCCMAAISLNNSW